ncbi:methylmalonyl-CoA mutase family protein [Dyadobacter aurulentus]|uniref:methylmalonyl-CoA mutase family protein n=1 Tax=Dyadobacter sp. UC 10 TaxID=2605428 RepID=UPI0011F37FFD|nr:methylmalonyl-CoA mutase family protein [Dyadobacter sp. UC 10]KAA0988957.1 hypothetical protein FXO21_01655 [Dyadobacter sp. UC 10]
MSSSFFSEFTPADKAAWEKQARKELKEKYGSLVKWNPAKDISIDSYHTAQDLDAKGVSEMQQSQRALPGWLNIPPVRFTETAQTNSDIKNVVNSGGDGALILLNDRTLSQQEFSRLFLDVRLSDHTFFFQSAWPADELFRRLSQNTGYKLRGGIAFDPVANWMRTGMAFEQNLEAILSLTKNPARLPGFRPVMVESHLYHNNGADPVQELAFTISSAVIYLDTLTDLGLSAAQALDEMFFSISIGTSYLIEISKIRALRHLLHKLAGAYDIPAGQSNIYIHAQTSLFYHSETASYTNLVRESAAAMSAVLGGCDALTVNGFQSHLPQPTLLSDRIARNISPVLAHEGFFDAVADPAAGSYAIENMSLKLSEAAWALFIEIEEKGGLIDCFKSGFVQKELRNSFDKKVSDLNHSAAVMIGVNRFNEKEMLAGNDVVEALNPDAFNLLKYLRLSSFFQNKQETP